MEILAARKRLQMQGYIFNYMRKILFFQIILLALTGNRVNAQYKELPKVEFPQEFSMVLKTNPLTILQGPIILTNEYRLASEIVVGPSQSSEIAISILGKSPFYGAFDTVSSAGTPKIIINGFRFQISHRFYINNALRLLHIDAPEFAPEGFYLGPLFSYSTARISDRFNNRFDRYFRITHTNINLIFGHQWITSSNITFDVFTGFGYKENIWIEHSPRSITNISLDDFSPYYRSNLKLILGWNVGYAF